MTLHTTPMPAARLAEIVRMLPWCEVLAGERVVCRGFMRRASVVRLAVIADGHFYAAAAPTVSECVVALWELRDGVVGGDCCELVADLMFDVGGES